MNLAVVGSRSFNDWDLMVRELDAIAPDRIISGGARGADQLAAKYARLRSLPLTEFKPDWKRDGRKAGIIRNLLIVDAADKVVVFWDGKSHGATSTGRIAKTAGKLLSLHKPTSISL